jgi:hypothetical protein
LFFSKLVIVLALLFFNLKHGDPNSLLLWYAEASQVLDKVKDNEGELSLELDVTEVFKG